MLKNELIDQVLKNWTSIAGPSISLAGALASWYWARRKWSWDVSKELGLFRADTIELLGMTLRVGNPTWRRVPLQAYSGARKHWERNLQERAALLSGRAHKEMNNLQKLLDQAETEFLRGMSLGGLAAIEALASDDFEAEAASTDTFNKLSRMRDRITNDPKFMAQPRYRAFRRTRRN